MVRSTLPLPPTTKTSVAKLSIGPSSNIYVAPLPLSPPPLHPAALSSFSRLHTLTEQNHRRHRVFPPSPRQHGL